MASAAELTSQIVILKDKLRIAQNGLKNLNPRLQANQAILARYRDEVATLPGQISSLQVQLEALQGSASSGTVVKDDQAARKTRSRAISPTTEQLEVDAAGRVQPRPETTTGSNALAGVGDFDVDQGLNGDLRTLTQTQAIIRNTQGLPVRAEDGELSPLKRNPEDGFLYVPLSPGVGAGGDDRGSNNVVASLNSIGWADKIVPQTNVLGQYASYTYQASLYLMDKKSYQQSIDSGRKDLSNAQILVQSGGAPQGPGRNNFFDLDCYIDRIDLKSFFVGKAVRLAHNVKEVSMTIVEPNGISFLENLNSAVQQFIGQSNNGADTYYENNGQSSTSGKNKKLNFTSQIYLLVVRFYGYDDQGNLVRGGVNKPDQTSDPNAFVEKWYPLIISKIGFKIANKVVEYEIQAKAPPYYVCASSGRGTIPFNMEFGGKDLKDLLAGPLVYAAGQNAVASGSNSNTAGRSTAVTPRPSPTAPLPFVNGPNGAAFGARLNVGRRRTPPPAGPSDPTDGRNRGIRSDTPTTTPVAPSPPPRADAANSVKSTVRSGLMAALNEYQQKLVKDGVVDYADVYEIEFVLDSMASAKITNAGLNKSATPMSRPGTPADQKLPAKQSMDPTARVQGATAGMQIVQFIDNAIRNSSYIKDQQTVIIEEKTGAEKTTGINIKNTAWYRIGFRATPMWDKYDTKRNDYVYKITYIISPFKIAQLNSPYFKVPTYPGPHKQYRYWFTGQNTEVLSYEESLNALYYIVMTNSNLGGATSSDNDALKYAPGTASGQNSQNAEGRTNEPSASAADQLYSPSDLKECNMTIVGDPSWLQQGEALTVLSKGDTYYYAPFLADGTINFDAQQILFEIGFNTPRDYDITTGLANPNGSKVNTTSQLDQQTQTPGPTQISRIYIAKECVSSFNKGKFTQNIKGSLMVYYPPKKAEERATALEARPSAAVAAAPTVAQGPRWTKANETGGGAVTGNPVIAYNTTLGNPNIRPGSLRERAAIANSLRAQGLTEAEIQARINPPIPVPGLPPPVPGSPLNPANRPLLNLNKNPGQVIQRDP